MVLFCGALFGTRLSYAVLDQLAKKKGVRIICPDRPGIGGTEDCGEGVAGRIGLWLGMFGFFLFFFFSLISL